MNDNQSAPEPQNLREAMDLYDPKEIAAGLIDVVAFLADALIKANCLAPMEVVQAMQRCQNWQVMQAKAGVCLDVNARRFPGNCVSAAAEAAVGKMHSAHEGGQPN